MAKVLKQTFAGEDQLDACCGELLDVTADNSQNSGGELLDVAADDSQNNAENRTVWPNVPGPSSVSESAGPAPRERLSLARPKLPCGTRRRVAMCSLLESHR